ncbi:MAG: PAS domain-containing protein [Janthinobacterium lividum]
MPYNDEHYRLTFELNPHTQWTATPQGDLDRVSPRWQEWTGTSGVGASWGEAMHPEDLERTWSVWKHSLATGCDYSIEHRARMRDGSYHWMHSRALPHRNAEGAVVKWYGMTQDIQDYKDALESLSRREQEFRALSEAGPNHAWMADPDGNIIWCNQRLLDFVGLPPAAMLGQDWSCAVHPDDLATTAATWALAIAQGSAYETEFRLRGHAGTPEEQYRWFVVRALPVHDADGRITRWVGTSIDNHQRKLNLNTLTRRNASLEEEVAVRIAERDRMWHMSTDLMLVARFNATIVAVNPAWTEILGWEYADVLGHRFMEFIHPDDAERTIAEVGVQQRGGRSRRFENRYRDSAGNWHWLSWTAVSDQSFIHAVARDVTEQKKRAQALREAEQALRQSQKMEAIGQLTGGIAHDFNNLLAGLVGNLQLLQLRLRQGQTEDLERYIVAANAAADRAATLTQRLLAYSRQQMLAPRPLAANALVHSMMDLLLRTVGPSIQIDAQLAPGLWLTLCDTHQLENALLNLVINARDAMPDGGLLTISTDNVEASMPGHESLPPGQYVMLCVADTGTGMSREVAERAFDPFFSTKPVGQGTGLGLSMTYGFVSQSGGQVQIASTPGQGTKMRIYLPRHQGAGHAIDDSHGAALASSLPLAGSGLTLLVVEDEEDIRKLLVEMLREWGYATIEAADGPEAMLALQGQRQVDLLVTDIGLPGPFDGRQLARSARRQRPQLKVLFITGFVGNPVARSTDLESGMQLLKKPFTLETFAQTIAAMTSQTADCASPGAGGAD